MMDEDVAQDSSDDEDIRVPEDWTEKYRPKSLSEVVGNTKAKHELREWAEEWNNSSPPAKRAVILAGKPGVGKTSAALALANDMGWGALEMNASDERNKEAVQKFVGRSAVDDTFSSSGDFVPYRQGKRTLLILDEADNVFGNEDRGGILEIKNTVEKTKQPMVLIVNDYYGLRNRSKSLSKLLKKIEFKPVDKGDIVQLLKNICRSRGISYDMEAVNALADRAEGDVRSALRDLQTVTAGRDKIVIDNLDVLGYRNREGEIFPTIRKILHDNDPIDAKKSIQDLDEEPRNLITWIVENLPREYKDPVELSKGFDYISKADIYLGRVRHSSYYRFWAYTNDLMTAGVCSVKSRPHRGFNKYAFPTWIRKMFASKGRRSTINMLSFKLARKTHTTSDRARNDIFPYFSILFSDDMEFRRSAVDKLNLRPEETAFLLDTDVWAPEVKELYQEEKEELKVKTVKKKKKIEKQEKPEEKPEKQKTLLEF